MLPGPTAVTARWRARRPHAPGPVSTIQCVDHFHSRSDPPQAWPIRRVVMPTSPPLSRKDRCGPSSLVGEHPPLTRLTPLTGSGAEAGCRRAAAEQRAETVRAPGRILKPRPREGTKSVWSSAFRDFAAGWKRRAWSVERVRCSNALTLYAFTLHALDRGYQRFVRITSKQPRWFLHGAA
jgi:hypothetical protein